VGQGHPPGHAGGTLPGPHRVPEPAMTGVVALSRRRAAGSSRHAPGSTVLADRVSSQMARTAGSNRRSSRCDRSTRQFDGRGRMALLDTALRAIRPAGAVADGIVVEAPRSMVAWAIVGAAAGVACRADRRASPAAPDARRVAARQRMRARASRRGVPGARRRSEAGMSGPGPSTHRPLAGRRGRSSRGSSSERTCSAVSQEVLLHGWR
jgi:hypothetical protein